jgi:4-carboxymuconolactone decarboxylase
MSSEMFDKGLAMRKEVLGAEYVENSLKNADSFTREFQQIVTEHCWGTVWTRPGLGKRDRSLLNLAMLVALNRPHEVELHVNGALNNGLTTDDIKEVFIQASVYCGVPAALDAFRVARKVFKDRGIKT